MMSRADKLYEYEKAIERELKNAEDDSINGDTILRFYNHSVAEGIGLGRIRKRLWTVRMLSAMLGKRFEEASKDDIVKLVARIEQRRLSPWTKRDYKVVLKQFYRWLRGKDKDETPPEVKWVSTGKGIPSKLLKRDLLSPDEVNRIIESTLDIQEKAIFSVLFDSGRRPGEILTLHLGDIEFDEMGARLRVDGKMGTDIVRICASAPRLALWIDNHPRRDDPSSPLWVIRKNGQTAQMTYPCLRKRLGKAVKRAGIEKRVWPYLFRHSRITPASTKLSYSEMCHVFGWKQGSDMPQFYVHLAGDDRDNAFLKMNGLPVQKNNYENGEYAPQVCHRCKRNNSPDAKFCNGCGLGLDIKSVIDVDQRKESLSQKIDTITDELAKSPEAVDMLLKSLRMLKTEKELNNGDLKHSTHT